MFNNTIPAYRLTYSFQIKKETKIWIPSQKLYWIPSILRNIFTHDIHKEAEYIILEDLLYS